MVKEEDISYILGVHRQIHNQLTNPFSHLLRQISVLLIKSLVFLLSTYDFLSFSGMLLIVLFTFILLDTNFVVLYPTSVWDDPTPP